MYIWVKRERKSESERERERARAMILETHNSALLGLDAWNLKTCKKHTYHMSRPDAK